METIKEGYTRVSTILAQWNHLAHIDKDVLANKCRIGTNVHAKIAAETDGIFLELQPDEVGYFESWKKWKEEAEMEMEKTEARLYTEEFKITGCVDGFTKGDILLDYKTSASANKKMWALQASMYHYLAEISGWQPNTDFLFIHLKKDGKKAKEIWVECTHTLRSVWMSAIETYRYFNG